MPAGRAPAPDLRLIVVTDARLAAPRSVPDIVAECLSAGAPAIQLRDKDATARELLGLAVALRRLTALHGALLLVNDRLDVALAAGADGVHLGPVDLPVADARRAAPPGFLIGYSTDAPERAVEAERAGASYIGCGAVFGTRSKREVAAGERIGPAGVARVAAVIRIPVVGIGGITPANAGEVFAAGAAGVAVVSAVMGARSPGESVRRLLEDR